MVAWQRSALIGRRPGFVEAEKARLEREESSRVKLAGIVNRHMSTLFDSSQEVLTPEQLAAEHAEMIANESPADQVSRVVKETFAQWLHDTRTLLLFSLDGRECDETSARLRIGVNVPEYALQMLLDERDVAAHLTALDERLRAALPRVLVSRTFKSIAIDSGAPPDRSLAMALGLAGIEGLIASLRLTPELGLAQLSIDDPRVASEREAQKERQRSLLWSL